MSKAAACLVFNRMCFFQTTGFTLRNLAPSRCRQQMSISTIEITRERKTHSALHAFVSEWSYSLTEHVQADFLGFLSCLVLGNASIISFIHFLDIFYYQFWAILVQAVLITRFKDNVVTVAEAKRGERHVRGSHHKCLLTQLEEHTNNFFNSLTVICLGFYLREGAAGLQQRL